MLYKLFCKYCCKQKFQMRGPDSESCGFQCRRLPVDGGFAEGAWERWTFQRGALTSPLGNQLLSVLHQHQEWQQEEYSLQMKRSIQKLREKRSLLVITKSRGIAGSVVSPEPCLFLTVSWLCFPLWWCRFQADSTWGRGWPLPSSLWTHNWKYWIALRRSWEGFPPA